jgi:exodeoxyribonuclease VII small subunit
VNSGLVGAEERRARAGRDRHTSTVVENRGARGRRYNKWMLEETKPSLNFETGLEELERVVKELEKGDLPLERSLELFERGMKLSAECKKMLEEAETRVEILTRRGAEMTAAPFNPEKPAR